MAQQIDIIANIITKVDGAEAGINKLKNSLSQLKIPDGLDKNLTKSFANLDGIFERYRNQLNKGFKTKGDVSAFAKTGKELEAELDRVSKYMTELTGKKIDFKVNSEPIKQAQKDLANLIEQQQKLSNQALNFKVDGSNGQSIQSLLEGIKKTAGDTKAGRAANSAIANLQMGDVASAKANIETIIASLGRLKKAKQDAEVVAGSGLNMAGAANAIKAQLDTATSGLQKVKTDADAAKASLEQMQGKQLGEAANQANKLAKDVQQVSASMNQANKSAQDFASSSFRMANQLDQLKSSTQYFFGLRNMINLLKQGFREALNTVKELDAAMTETAVVTKFDVGDMWEKLPEYTANANALGATVQDMYKSATLYYQQGLNAQQAMSIASETMKMARIGGLEAADATDMMTAALRGFNMELSSESAQRINDVYSNLAAKTASNTQELGEAMERTASIAHSAGMSFEGTSAFLAQMIETTREAPENLGTAMKTIIARFQELKKNPLEMEEVDGEEVSFNKVDTALQSIGVTLRDTNGQFRELDQVFLDIASRWDGLSQTQQRYIATTAAGSRQQSRFIAMMNNYDRTVQLMDYANNSTGASNEQFGKTMESLEAKLNKLKNAWDLFRMGLADNSMIKGAVDGLTKFVNTVTKLIDTLSFGSGKIKSALTIFTAFLGLRAAGRGINALLGGLGGMLDPNSSILKGAFGGGLIGSQRGNAAVQAKLINQPIVNVLNQILGAVRTGKTGAQDSGTRADYKKSLNDFRSVANKPGAKISDTLGTLKGLDGQQMRLISKSNVGTMRQLQRSMAETDMGKVLAAQTITAMKRGGITGNQLAGMNKANIGTILGTKEAQAYSESFAQNVQKNILPKWKETQQAVSEKIRSQARYSDPALFAGMSDAQGKQLSHLDLISKTKLNQQTGEVEQNPYYNPKYVETFKKMTKAEREAIKQQAALGEGAMQQKTPLEKIQQSLSHIGGSAITAGQGLMSLGATLNSMGFEAAGAAVTSFGSALSNLGMIANGLPAIFSILSNQFGAIAAAAGALIGIVTVVSNSHIKQIKEDAKKVTDSFKQTQDETSKNIESVKTWKEEMATLSKGVDANGLNVNLSDVDYAHYLEIVDSIAKMNPDIVKGYTAQGHAIIDNNTALDETLTKLQEIQNKATEDYLDVDKGLQKLIDARNIDKEFVKANTMQTSASRTTRTDFTPNVQVRSVAPLASDVMSLVSQLENQKGLDAASVLKTYNINLEELKSGEQSAINRFVQFQDKINADVSKAVASSTEDLNEGVSEGFSKLSDSTAAFDESIQPVLQNLQTYAANLPGFDNIGDEFQSAINMGLKDIAILPDLDATQMQEQVRNLIQQFDDLTYEGSAYATAMEEVEAAQDQFASSLDVSEYAKNTENALTTLNNLLEQYEGDTTAYGQAVTEYLTNQIARIKKFTEEGAVSLTEALNTATTDIAAAEGAYQAFQDATKTDMSTGADNMKSIFDEITKDTEGVQLHMQDKGDNTLWKGMEAMFSEDAIQKAAEKGPEAVQSMLNRIKPMLQEGQAGFDAFWNDMFSDENVAKLKQIKGVMIDQKNGEIKWDDDVNPDVFHEMAEQLGYADQYLASMLNKGRQFADIDFMDTSDVRKALSTDNAAIKGTSTTTITDVQGKTETVSDLFVKEDYLKNALRDSGLSNPVEIQNAIDNMTKNGVKIIPNPNDMTKKDFKNMGITDIPSLVRTLGDTGQFNRSEIEEYAKQLPDYNAKELDTVYKDYLDSQEHPELPSLNSIDSNVASIASAIIGNRMAEGHVDEATVQAYEDAKRLVNGENGHNKGEADSVSELFALGKNSKGEALSKAEYDATLKLLNKQIDDYTRKSEQAEQGAEKARAEGRDAEADELLKEARGYRELAKRVEEDRGKGEEVHKNLQNADESTQQKTAGMPSDINQILDKQKQDRELQEAADQKKSEALAKQTEEYNKQKKAQEEAEQVRAQGLVEQTKQYNQQKEEQKKAQEEAEKVRAQGLVKQTEEINKQKESEQIAENAVNNTVQGVQKSGEYIIGAIANNLAGGVQEEANKTDGAAYSGIKKINPGPLLGSMLEKIWPDSDDLKFENTDTNTWGTRNLNNSRKNLWNSLIEGWDSLFGEEDSIPEEGDTSFVSKVESSAQKLGEALKKGWDALHKNTPSEPTTPTQPSSPTQTASTVSQGGNVVTSVAQQVVQTVSTQEQGLDETKQKLESINSTANKGANMKVKASSDGSLTTAEKALNKLKGSAASGATIKVNSGKGDVIGKTQQNAAKGAEMPLKIRDLATSKINQINANARKPVSKTVNISPNYTGTWRKDIYIGKTGPGANNLYTGANNKISFHHVPMAGSLARGTKKGRVGPRNRGGLTLTGEEGYEIAWIPSESRSAILGASGPEMVNLPKEAVIYNHDQSKEIMKKRKSISAGSMGSGSASYKSAASTTITTSTSFSSSGNPTKQFVDNAKKVGDDLSKKAQNTSEAITRVTVWWENAARRADSIQRKIDANQDEYQKYLKKLSATLHETGENGGNAFVNENRKYIAEQELQYNKATNELGSMTTSAAKSKKGRKKQYKKGADNVIQVSYEGKKNKKGQAKTKTAYVDTSKYLTIDSDSGAYQINQQALKKIGNKKKRKAVADQLNKELNDRLAKQKAAEENIRKAQEAYEKFSEELYNTFFAWENELTKIWNITQKIEAILDRISRGDSMDSLLKAQIHSGLGDTEGYRKQMVSNFSSRVESQQEAIRQRRQAIDQSRIDLATKVAGQDVSQILAKVDEKLRGTLSENDRAGYQKYREELAEQQKVRTTANKYLTTETNASDGTIKINFDSAKFEEDRLAGLITNDMGKSIQDLVKELQDDSKNLNNLYKEQTEALTELYDTLDDLNKEQADMAAELLDINEEANKKEIEELQKLNDSIKQAMDDLLNEVKRKLDERRKLEENSKTERDISQKQQRLAILRADTSGGHAVEIAQLEKEIQEAQSSYQQSLEDQLLDKLQNQADEASKQRERQIKLQEETLSSVNNIETVQKWMAAPEAFKDQIYERWREAKKYDQLTDVQQAEEDRNFLTNYSNLLSNGAKRGSVVKAIADNTVEEARRKEEDELELTNNEAVAKWEQTRNKLYAFGKVTTENWRQVEEAFNVTDTGWNNLTNEQRALTNFDKRDEILKGIKDNKIANFEQIIEQTNAELDQLDNQQLLINQQLEAAGSELNRAFQNVDAARTAYAAQLQAADQARARGVLIQPSNKYVLAAEAQVKKVQQRIRQLYEQLDGVFASRAQKQELIEQTQEQLKILKYKKGGIADFTGPAWLDGTPSKPELVLNATDTKNFIALKDVLSRVMSSTGHIENSYGGNANFEININVDHISNDYDVNKVVDQVEKRIVQKSGYRNVTQVRNFR